MWSLRRNFEAAAARTYVVGLVRGQFPAVDSQTIAYRLAYGSFVSLRHKILYVETPKVACTTIKEYLRDLCEAPPLTFPIKHHRESRRDMFVHIRSNVPLPSLLDLDEETQRHVLTSPEFLRFGIVRNPYSRLLSAWRNKVLLCEPGYEYIYRKMTGNEPSLREKETLTFEQFLEFVESEDVATCNPHWRRQTDLLLYPAIPFTHLGKIERLRETFELIEKHADPGKSLPARTSNSTRVGYANLTEALAVRIYKLYAADFEAFGYNKDSWRALNESEHGNRTVPETHFVDEVIERNLVLSHLYEQYAQLQSRYRTSYRFSLTRIQDTAAALWKAGRRLSGAIRKES